MNSTTGVPWCDPSFACEHFICHHLILGAFRFEAVEGRDSGLAVGQPWLGLERCLKGCYAIGVGHLGFYILLDRIQPSFTFLTGFRSIGFGDSGRNQFKCIWYMCVYICIYRHILTQKPSFAGTQTDTCYLLCLTEAASTCRQAGRMERHIIFVHSHWYANLWTFQGAHELYCYMHSRTTIKPVLTWTCSCICRAFHCIALRQTCMLYIRLLLELLGSSQKRKPDTLQ